MPLTVPATVRIISHRLWRSQFGGDPNVVGRTVQLNGRPFRIIGVAAAGFNGHNIDSTGIWMPLTAFPDGDDAAVRPARSAVADGDRPAEGRCQHRAGASRDVAHCEPNSRANTLRTIGGTVSAWSQRRRCPWRPIADLQIHPARRRIDRTRAAHRVHQRRRHGAGAQHQSHAGNVSSSGARRRACCA